LKTTYGAQVVDSKPKDQRIERSKQWLSMSNAADALYFKTKKTGLNILPCVHEPMAEYG
jgi:hypothetical protein